ncbi:MAG: winged helix-turn-helix domain-containing protein [bacterium]|nr:winged helix-turn-helix domain-containing protein [bacterium]
MQDIRMVLKAKRDALQRLQAEIDVLERAQALLEGDSLEPSPRRVVLTPEKRLTGAQAKNHFAPTSQVGLAIAVLRDAGSPLHVTEIMRRIMDRGGSVKKASLVGSLARLVNEKRVFVRKRPNVFGLLEWAGGPPTLPLQVGNGGSSSAELSRGNPTSESTPGAGWAARH